MKPDAQAVFDDLDRLVSEATPDQLPTLSAALSAKAAAVAAKLVLVKGPRDDGHSDLPDVNLDVKEAAHRLGVSAGWFYKHQKLPFIRRIGRKVLISANELARWNRSRKP